MLRSTVPIPKPLPRDEHEAEHTRAEIPASFPFLNLTSLKMNAPFEFSSPYRLGTVDTISTQPITVVL